ncbi:oxidoreductase [Paraflavitalea pollutisoli]|uniref:oxidoreductase n=1 Tax=Paraflavitalea pollutisoli TaxID=3034143 RepID=UPI0023ECBAE8|nr:oxidoreductase [Paraflavitalea sp. H1-2-19X]
MSKVWFITGSSRGLGRSLTEAVLASGYRVVATARKPEQLQDLVAQYPGQILPVRLDVTNKTEIKAAVAAAIDQYGRIDVLVNNAGFGITGAAEAFTDEQVTSQLEANLYGPIEITRAIIPYMRRQKSGRILQISSIGGRTGTPGITIYQAAKWGLSGFSEALAKELSPLGILVTSVEPGGFRTDWAGDSMSFAPFVEGYEESVEKVKHHFRGEGFVPMGDPRKAARVMIELSENPEPPVHLVLGSEAVAILEMADAKRTADLQKWKPVSVSTDHDDAVNFLDTPQGKMYSQLKTN